MHFGPRPARASGGRRPPAAAGAPPPEDGRHPGVEYDPAQPLFGQLGKDARQASAERGETGLNHLVEELAGRILQFLADG